MTRRALLADAAAGFTGATAGCIAEQRTRARYWFRDGEYVPAEELLDEDVLAEHYSEDLHNMPRIGTVGYTDYLGPIKADLDRQEPEMYDIHYLYPERDADERELVLDDRYGRWTLPTTGEGRRKVRLVVFTIIGRGGIPIDDRC